MVTDTDAETAAAGVETEVEDAGQLETPGAQE